VPSIEASKMSREMVDVRLWTFAAFVRDSESRKTIRDAKTRYGAPRGRGLEAGGLTLEA